MRIEHKELLGIIACAIGMSVGVFLFAIGITKYNHSLSLESYDWQPLYWAPDERVIDGEGVPLQGRVVDGVIEISREE